MAEGIGFAGALEQTRYELRTVALGATIADRLRIVRMLVHAHLRIGRGRALIGWLPQGPDPPRDLRLRSGISILCRRADVGVLYEQFGAEVYDAATPPDAQLEAIVDLGANIGSATIALARKHPAARFVCVEPAAETRTILEANLSRNGIPAEVFGVAVVGHSGRYRLETGRHPGMNRVSTDHAGEIDGITLAELLDRACVQTVDFLKIDIEGAERELFETASSWGLRVRTLVAELHDGFSAEEAMALLRPEGFEPVPLQRGLRHHGLVCCTQTRGTQGGLRAPRPRSVADNEHT